MDAEVIQRERLGPPVSFMQPRTASAFRTEGQEHTAVARSPTAMGAALGRQKLKAPAQPFDDAALDSERPATLPSDKEGSHRPSQNTRSSLRSQRIASFGFENGPDGPR
jgi:hypothetical protein